MLIKKLSGNQLKLIAVVAMLVDHIGYLLKRWTFANLTEADSLYAICRWSWQIMRAFGRIAFPVFCFLLVEGFFHTKDWKKYALRLGVFAVISEVPFDLMMRETMVYWQYQNIFFTLLIGLLMMASMKAISLKYPGEQGMLLQLMSIVAACGLAWVIHADYDYSGIMLIALLYWFRGEPRRQLLLGYVWMALSETSWLDRFGAIFGFLPLLLYNGERGRRRMGPFFYWFYPLHLLILSFIYRLV